MELVRVDLHDDLSGVVKVLNDAHRTVADEFKFTKESNPTNNAFIDERTLRAQLGKGIELYQLADHEKVIGCIAIEKSATEADTFYIEKVSVIPGERHQGFGVQLMKNATGLIRERGGKWISIALIDSNRRLKKWYLMQGFKETGTKDFPRLPFRVCFMKKEI